MIAIDTGNSAARRIVLKAVLIAGVLAPACLFLLYSWQSHRVTFASAREHVVRESQALSEQLARVFDAHAAILDLFVVRLDGMVPGDILSSPKLFQAFKPRLNDPMISSVLVIDRDGKVVAASQPYEGLQVGDRDFFRQALQTDDLVISKPLLSRVTGEKIIPVARRWGGGVIAVVLLMREIEDMIAASVDAGDDGVRVVLDRADGMPLLAWPMGGDPETGRLPALRGIDGLLSATQGLRHHPMQVTYAVPAEQVTARWLYGLLPQGLLAVMVTVILAGAAVVVWRRDRSATAAVASSIAEMARANRAVSQFFDAASHDFGQPVQGVRLFLDVLDQRLTDEGDRLVLAQASAALEGVEGLLANLREVSLIEAGLVEPQISTVMVGEVIQSVVADFQSRAIERGLSLRAVPSRMAVLSDPALLGRILRCLLANALAFTNAGGVVVGVRRRRGTVRLEVWDSGVGIPAEHLQAVFNDFVQLENPERDRRKGLGLGLAVVRRLLVLLGHPAGVSSWPGRGSLFWIELPKAPVKSGTLFLPGSASPSRLAVGTNPDRQIGSGSAPA